MLVRNIIVCRSKNLQERGRGTYTRSNIDSIVAGSSKSELGLKAKGHAQLKMKVTYVICKLRQHRQLGK